MLYIEVQMSACKYVTFRFTVKVHMTLNQRQIAS